MTLSVGGTVFCCCAVLMDDDDDDQSSDDNNNDGDELVLFSVIVALAPQVRTSSIPSWMETSGSNQQSGDDDGITDQQELLQAEQSPMNLLQGKMGQPTAQGRASESFLSIRRVHVSLGRLCRILEREERRCRYVSVQASLFEKIRNDLSSSNATSSKNRYSYWQTESAEDRKQNQQKASSSASGATILNSDSKLTVANSGAPALPPTAPISSPPPVASTLAAGTSPSSKASSKATPSAPTIGGSAPTRHRRAGSNFTVSFEREITVAASNKTTTKDETSKKKDEKDRLLELEQVILEVMMAAPPTHTTINNSGSSDFGATTIIEHQGNLAREMVQVYHAMGRNDHDFAPTPSILLSGREGVVYINRHLAIAIEPVSSSRQEPSDHGIPGVQRPLVRPYHTLLFPSASPSELLDSMTTTAMAPRRLQQLLRMVNPQKSLTDIAVDTNLPLHTTLDIAAYLVCQGAALSAPVLSRKIRLATVCGTRKIQQAALAFSQEFGASVNLLLLVGFLTEPSRNLGDCMALLTTSNEENTVWLRDCFLLCLSTIRRAGSSQDLSGGGGGGTMQTRIDAFAGPTLGVDDERVPNADDLEELLYQMVVWLCSHEVLVQLQDYLVAKFVLGTNSNGAVEAARTIDEDESLHQQFESNIRHQRHQHAGERKSDANVRLDLLSDELLFQELLESDCLSGKITVQACCWKTGLDPVKLYQLVNRSPQQIRIVTRVPCKGDDWDGEW